VPDEEFEPITGCPVPYLCAKPESESTFLKNNKKNQELTEG
jgi:hypothetical protein